jgi:uncharacterized membrane protein YhaH (DUF805 family)
LGVIAAIIAAILTFTDKHAPYGEIVLVVLCVPRLHDIGQPGWWVGGAIIAEIAVLATAFAALAPDAAMVVMGLFVLLILVGLVVLGALPGQKGTNKYGAEPAPGLSFGRANEQPEKVF